MNEETYKEVLKEIEDLIEKDIFSENEKIRLESLVDEVYEYEEINYPIS